MKRRGFFAALLAVPFIPYAAKSAKADEAPFVFQDGVLHLNDVRVNSLSALSASLGSVDISECWISPQVTAKHDVECYSTGYRVRDPLAKPASMLMDVPAGEHPKAIKLSDLKLR
jgi:hypothetical protein